jgi:hypothetical protein
MRLRVVEGARLEIALAVCDGVLRISITVAKSTTSYILPTRIETVPGRTLDLVPIERIGPR